MEGFIPTTGEAALQRTGALKREGTPVTPEEAAKHFAALPEGAEISRRVYAQLGQIFTVKADGTTTNYILEHGDPDFPEGKAVIRQ